MKVLIAYRSRYGTAQSIAGALARKISSDTVVHDLSARGRPSLAEFDVILIGGSIYGGKIQREIPSFCDQERESLLSKKVGLFISSFYTDERGMAQLQEAFPPWLSAHAFAREVVGGKLSVEKLSLLDRILVRSIIRPARDISTIQADAIDQLAAAVLAFPFR